MSYNIGDMLVDGTGRHNVIVCKVKDKYRKKGELWYDLIVYKVSNQAKMGSLPRNWSYPEDCMNGYIVVKDDRELLIELL